MFGLRFQYWLFSLIALGALGTQHSYAAPAQVVARTGESAIGVPGYTYNGLFRDNAAPPTPLPAPMMAGDLVGLFSSLRQGATAPVTDKGLWLLHQNGQGRVVARQGILAPGTEAGTIFQSLISASAHEYGRLLLIASLQGSAVTPGLNSRGVWEGDLNQTSIVLREAEVAPGTSPVGHFRSITEAVGLDGSVGADLAISSIVTSLPGAPITVPVTSGIWARTGADLEMVSWSFGDAPGLPSTWFTDAYHQIGASGRGATVARMYGPNVFTIVVNGTSVISDWVVLRTGPGSRQIIARTATQAPGTPAGVVFRSLGSSTALPAVNSAGDAIFSATVIGPGVTTLASTGLWRSTANGVSLFARGGDPAPAAGAGVILDSLYANASDGSLALMNNGDVAFWTYFAGTGVTLNNCRGIYKRSPSGQDSLIARSGVIDSALPSGTTLVRTALPLAMKAAGDDHVMFTAQLTGTGVTSTNNDALFRHRQPSGLQLIAREGDTIGSHVLKSFVDNGADMQITGNGYAVVPVTLSPASNPTATPQAGILGISPSGAVQVLAARNSAITLSDGTSPTITDLRIAAKSALSENGKVALAALFSSTPRDEAVFVASIEEGEECAADFDRSGAADDADLAAFLYAWFAQESVADFDRSGAVAVPDIFAFLTAWFEGC